MLYLIVSLAFLQPQDPIVETKPQKPALSFDAKPSYVTANATSSFLREYTSKVVQHFEAESLLGPFGKRTFTTPRKRSVDMAPVEQAPNWKSAATGKHRRRTGYADCYRIVAGQRNHYRVGFVQLSPQVSFEEYLANYQKMYPGTVPEFLNEQKTHAFVSFEPITSGAVTSNKDPMFLRFEKGLVLKSTNDSILSFPIEHVKRILDTTRNDDILHHYNPSNFSKASVTNYLRQLALQAGVKMQQYDGETDEPWKLRRSLQENYLRLFEARYRDIKLSTVKMKMATDSKPFRVRAEVEAKPGSELAKLLNSLPMRGRGLDVEPLESTLAFAKVRMLIPVPLRQLVKASIAIHPELNSSSLGRVLARATNTGELDFVSHVSEFGDGRPVLFASMKTAESTGLSSLSFPTDGIIPETEQLKTAIVGEGNRLNAIFGLTEFPADFESDAVTESSAEKSKILYFEGDLSRWRDAPEGSASRIVLESIESAMEEFQFRRMNPPVAWTSLGKLTSFANKMDPEDDYRFTVSVTIQKDKLIADATVGAGLCKLFMMHHIMMFNRTFDARLRRSGKGTIQQVSGESKSTDKPPVVLNGNR